MCQNNLERSQEDYILRQVKKSRVATRELFLFYITCIRSILEYGSPVIIEQRPRKTAKTRYEDFLL